MSSYFGNLLNFNSHVHAIVLNGVFLESGKFISIDSIPAEQFLGRYQPAKK